MVEKIQKGDIETFVTLLGNDFIMPTKAKATAEQAFKDKKFVALLFSAGYTPPCKSFVKKYLVPFYKEINDEFKQLEIVYVSMDHNFNDYRTTFLETMPWYALKHKDLHTEPLIEKYSVKCIPTLVILNAKGELISDVGRVDVMVDEFDAFNNWTKKAEEIQEQKLKEQEEKEEAQEEVKEDK